MSGWEGWVCVCVWGGGLIIEILFFRVGGGGCYKLRFTDMLTGRWA